MSTQIQPAMSLEHAKACVCRIELIKDNRAVGYGTGFHIGGGRIVTNSHVASMGSQLRITFEDPEAKTHTVYEPVPRKCVYAQIHLDSDRRPDLMVPDIAMLFLNGDEDASKLKSIDLARRYQRVVPPIAVGLKTQTLHYGVVNKARAMSILHSTDEEITIVSPRNPRGTHACIHSRKCRLPGGSSGAPVFSENFDLLGVHFAGNPNTAHFIDLEQMLNLRRHIEAHDHATKFAQEAQNTVDYLPEGDLKRRSQDIVNATYHRSAKQETKTLAELKLAPHPPSPPKPSVSPSPSKPSVSPSPSKSKSSVSPSRCQDTWSTWSTCFAVIIGIVVIILMAITHFVRNIPMSFRITDKHLDSMNPIHPT